MPKPTETKTKKLRAMLKRRRGASLPALCKATGWQVHSVRAALSGLRKAGYEIVRDPVKDKVTPAIYRIARAAEVAE